jgi:hypothetical protein
MALHVEPDAAGLWTLSYDHVTDKDWRKLREGAKVNWCREITTTRKIGTFERREFAGYMVLAPERGMLYSVSAALRDSGFSEALINILEIAARSDCVAVRLLTNGPEEPGLAVF